MLNNSSNLYGSEWLAVVFTNRNKSYGAYALRAQSSTNTMKALFIAAPIFILLFVGPAIYAKLSPDEPVLIGRIVTLSNVEPIHEMKKEEPKKEEPIKAKPIEQKPVKSVKLTANIKVVNNPVDDTPPPTSDQLKGAIVSNVTSDGEPAKNAAPPGIDGGKGTQPGVDNLVHEAAGVDVYPEFPGGMAAFGKFIQRNLRYPSAAQDEGIQGKVFLSFVVEKDGSITDVRVVRGIGYGCDDEAKRVILKSPRWKPGAQNNQAVRVRYNVPINYTINN